MTVMMDALRLAEHFKLKERYGRYLKIAGLLAISFHLLGAVLSPPYVPSPYQLQDEKLQIIEIPDEIVVPPPPKTIERPQIPAEMEISDLANPLETLAPTAPEHLWAPPHLPPDDDGPKDFWDAKPVAVHQVVPIYPEMARQAEAEGTVHVAVVIDEMGRVISAEVVESTATEVLEVAAVSAASQWLFKPAMQRDKPVKSTIVIPFVFSLD
jgi:TonB family protein